MKPIYYKENDYQVRLLPEFIYGYIPVDERVVKKIINNPNYKDNHNLVNDNLYYDQSVYYKLNKPSLKRNDISTIERYNILYKAYKDTLEKYNLKQAISALLELIDNHKVNYFSGKDNRLLLAKYVSYNDPCKIISAGLNTNTDNISDLINLFNLSIINDVNNVKENTKQGVLVCF